MVVILQKYENFILKCYFKKISIMPLMFALEFCLFFIFKNLNKLKHIYLSLKFKKPKNKFNYMQLCTLHLQNIYIYINDIKKL